MQNMASPNHEQYPVQDASYKQQTKQKYKPNHQQTGLPPYSALPIRSKSEKQQQKTQHKSHPIRSLHKLLEQPQDGGNQKEKEFNLKPGKRTPQTHKLKKIIMKRQQNTTKMKGKSRSTEVQINEEEIGKLPEK